MQTKSQQHTCSTPHMPTISVWNSSLFASLRMWVPSSASLLCFACLKLCFCFCIPPHPFTFHRTIYCCPSLLWLFHFLAVLILQYSSFHTFSLCPPLSCHLCFTHFSNTSHPFFHLSAFLLPVSSGIFLYLSPSLQHSVLESLAVYCMAHRGTCLWYPGA